jgi:DDE superfamily endonuclease
MACCFAAMNTYLATVGTNPWFMLFVLSKTKAETSKDREDFNTCVAKARVTNKHCIGVLKSRWHSLKEMCIQLKTNKEKEFLVRWIVLCAKLRNFVITHNDD